LRAGLVELLTTIKDVVDRHCKSEQGQELVGW
jgi:hypothetical protein